MHGTMNIKLDFSDFCISYLQFSALYTKRRTPLLRWELAFYNVPLIVRGSVMTSFHRTLNTVARRAPNDHGVALRKDRGVIVLWT